MVTFKDLTDKQQREALDNIKRDKGLTHLSIGELQDIPVIQLFPFTEANESQHYWFNIVDNKTV